MHLTVPNKCHLLQGTLRLRNPCRPCGRLCSGGRQLLICLFAFCFPRVSYIKGKICLLTSLLPTSDMGIHGKEAAETSDYRRCPWWFCVDLWLQAAEHQAVHLFKDGACVAVTQPSAEFSRDGSENGRDRLSDSLQPAPGFSSFKAGLKMGMDMFAGGGVGPQSCSWSSFRETEVLSV